LAFLLVEYANILTRAEPDDLCDHYSRSPVERKQPAWRPGAVMIRFSKIRVRTMPQRGLALTRSNVVGGLAMLEAGLPPEAIRRDHAARLFPRFA
jgi:hypothetical protein